MKIVGNKFQLRDWRLDDLPIFKQWNEGHHLWMDFNGPYYSVLSTERLGKLLKVYREKIISQQWLYPRKKLVIANNKDEVMMGMVSWYWQSEETNWKSIGLVIYDESFWNKGIGYEALKLWIQYLFDQEPDLVRLDLRTWSGNWGMIRLAEKLGFIEEARFRKARIVKGEYYDSVAMGILREEWEQRSVEQKMY